MKIVCNTLIIASLYASVDAGSLRNLKGKRQNSPYAVTSYVETFCGFNFVLEEGDTYVTATSPWDTGALDDLDKDEATDDEIATALEALDVCGGNGGAGDPVNCNDAESEAACGVLAETNICNWTGAGKCNGPGLSLLSYEATFEDSDITCSGVRDVYVSTSHGDSFADGSTCEDNSGCTLGDGTAVAKGEAIPDGSTCDNTSVDPEDGVVTEIPCYSKHPEDYDGYYMCYNPNSPHLYPRTICQPNDEEPAAMIDGSTFASCGWCCQTEAGDNQWTNDACGDKEDIEDVGCDSDEDGENDGFLVEVANGKNQKKNGDKPLQTAGKCVTYDDIAGTLNHFWGSFCVP